jgi:ATP-dependent DNA helicase RecG
MLDGDWSSDVCSSDLTNVLETTATPISRSMALLEHGDKALIQIDAQHATKSISTELIENNPDDRAGLFRQLKEAVAAGEQVVIVYPKVEGSSEKDTASLLSMQELWERTFPGQTIVLHGKMPDDEKIRTMERIKNREAPVIITTVILEIGITIKDLRYLMIVRPDRVGVFTLHQLRGRLVRHGGEGRFMMYLQEAVKDETRERLEMLCQTNNGFELSQLVMERNGFGELASADGAQTGKTPTLFTGIKLMPSDFQD